jgi:hypothetical protein
MLLDAPFGAGEPRPTVLPAPLRPAVRAEALGTLLEALRPVRFLRYDSTLERVREVSREFARDVATSRLAVDSVGLDLVVVPDGSATGAIEGAESAARGWSADAPSDAISFRVAPVGGTVLSPPIDLVFATEVGIRRLGFRTGSAEAPAGEAPSFVASVPFPLLRDEVRLFGIQEAFAYAEALDAEDHERVVGRSTLVRVDLEGLASPP